MPGWEQVEKWSTDTKTETGKSNGATQVYTATSRTPAPFTLYI